MVCLAWEDPDGFWFKMCLQITSEMQKRRSSLASQHGTHSYPENKHKVK